MKYLKQFFIIPFLLFLSFTYAANIIPDPFEPIAISTPTKSQFGDINSVIKIAFTLAPSNNSISGFRQEFSSGLYYHQYIGITIPKAENTFQIISPGPDKTAANVFLCEGVFYDNDDGFKRKPLLFSPQIRPLFPFNTAFCRLEDGTYYIKPGTKIELYITFAQASTELLGKTGMLTVSVFTSSSNEMKYIFDSMPVFASFVIHPKYTQTPPPDYTATPPRLPKKDTFINIELEPSNIPLIIDTIVDFYATVTLDDWMLFSDFSFVFNYEPRCFIVEQSRASVELLKGKADSDPFPPTGSFFLRNFTKNNDYHSIAAEFTHYGEVIESQKFIIAYKGIGLLNKPAKDCRIEISIQYKNTDAVFGYIENRFDIIGPTISLKAKNPENIREGGLNEYYKSGAFPIQFTISSSLAVSDFYYKIQHTNLDETKKIQITFIASTCDLTGLNDAIPSQLFAARPNCYPIYYENEDATTTPPPDPTDGSGFFLYIKGPMEAYTDYTLTIWAFFDQCGAGWTSTDFFVHVEISAEFYRTINKDQYARKRFTQDNLLAKSSNTDKDILCYNTNPGGTDITFGIYSWGSTDPAINERFWYREYFDWDLFKWNSQEDKLPDITTNTKMGYFNPLTSANQLNDGDDILARVKVDCTQDKFNCYPMGLNSEATPTKINSKIIFKFSNHFVKKTTNDVCYISWTFEPTWNVNTCTDAGECNWIGLPNANTPATEMGNLADVYSSEIISSADFTNGLFSFGTPTVARQACSGTDYSFGLANNCHQLKNVKEKVTSLYQSFQIIIAISDKDIAEKRNYRRMMRLIKLFPEGGVFNEITKTSMTTLFKNYYSFQTKSDMYGVCLLELTAPLLPSGDIPNTMMVWILLGSLIETDYERSSEYPVTNLNPTVQTYGYTSQHGYNPTNFYFTDSKAPINRFLSLKSTTYHFYMGSLLIFNQIGANYHTGPMIIPYYCPQKHPSADTDFELYPKVMIAYADSIDHSNWTSGVPNYLINGFSGIDVFTFSDGPKTTVPGVTLFSPVRFSPFSNAVNEIQVYLASGSPTCNTHTLMFEESLFEGKTIISSNPNAYQYTIKTGFFYPYGKSFKGLYMQKGPVFANDLAFDVGFKPTMQNFATKDNKISTLDKVGYWCVGDGADILSNYDVITGNEYVASYSEDTAQWIVTLSGSSTSATFTADPAESIVFTIKLTASELIPPIGSIMTFKINPSPTMCGITGENNYLNECTLINPPPPGLVDPYFTCDIVEAKPIINVSCYNINLSTAPTPIAFTDFNLRLPNTPSKYDSQLDIDPLTDTIVQSVTIAAPTPITHEEMILKYYIDDSYTYHLNAFGKIYFELNLQRDLTRDTTIILTILKLNTFASIIKPIRCVLSFKPKYPYRESESISLLEEKELEKAIFESCQVDEANNLITIKTKKISYKHSYAFSKLLYIHLWPVVISNIDYEKYTIKATASGISLLLAAAVTVDKFLEPLHPELRKDDLEADIEGKVSTQSIAELTDLSVHIPGEKSDYTFTFTLTQSDVIAAFPGDFKLNEIILHFPASLYPSIEENILCYDGDITSKVMLPCYYSFEGVLNIEFASDIKNTVQKVTLSNLINPDIDLNMITFAYSLNSFDDNSEKLRFTRLYGVGVVTIASLSTIGKNEVLRFHKLPELRSSISKTEARVLATHTFRIGIDLLMGNTPLVPVSLTACDLVIEFPKDYQLYLPLLNIPNVQFDEYQVKDSKPIKANTNSFAHNIKGNRLFIPVGPLSIASTFLFWEVEIKDVPLPKDLNEDYAKHTGIYHMILMCNQPPLTYYSTPINSYTHTTDWVEHPNSFRHSQWYKGNLLNYGDKEINKWFIDVVSTTANINHLEIQPGRFFKARFKAKENPKAQNAITDITLDDPIFMTLESKYTVVTADLQGTEFHIGCKCDTPPGAYYVNFVIVNTDEFAVMGNVKILLYVDRNKISKITYDKPMTMPIDSSFWLRYYIEEPNVDALTIKWTIDDIPFTKIDIPPRTITDKSTGTEESYVVTRFALHNDFDYKVNFTAENPNNCYEFEIKEDHKWFFMKPEREIIQQPIPLGFPLVSPMITFKNSEDALLPNESPIPKNSLKFTFQSPTTPAYLYCSLQCTELPIPTASELHYKEYSDYLARVNKESPYKKSHAIYIPYHSPTQPIDFVINDLIRGMNYRLVCLLESADAKWTRSVHGMMLGTTTNGILTKVLQPTPPLQSYCVTQTFTDEMTNASSLLIKTRLVNLCQKYFNGNKDSKENGCIICSDYTKTIISKGYSLTRNTCTATSRLLNEINRELIVTEASSSEYNPYTFSVCAQQDVRCPTDPQPINFETQFSNFVKTIQSKVDIQLHYNLTDIPLNDAFGGAISDDSIIEADRVYGEITSWDISKISFKAYYDGKNILGCYYKISEAATPVPSVNEMETCAMNNKLCGGIVILSEHSETIVRKLDYVPLKHLTKYIMYLGCTNLSPQSRHSAVISIGSFTTEQQSILCPDGTTNNFPSCLSCCSLNMSLILILLFILLTA